MSDCTCGTPDRLEPWQCEHFHVWRGSFRLTSVGRVLREAWPIKPSWDAVDPAVIENARERGEEVDRLFSAWLNGQLTSIPAGTREDSKERMRALCDWWQDSGMLEARAQVLLANQEYCGIVDLISGGGIYDVKNTAAIETTYILQLGGYADLYEEMHGCLPSKLGVIHVTQPKDRPVSVRLLEFDVATAVSQWRLLKEFWTMVQRIAGKRNQGRA